MANSLDFNGEWHATECVLDVLLYGNLQVDLVRLADSFASVMYIVGK